MNKKKQVNELCRKCRYLRFTGSYNKLEQLYCAYYCAYISALNGCKKYEKQIEMK